jgi:hypothetical protein
MSFMETVKEHPYMAAGGVFVLGVVLIVILAGGNGSGTQVAAKGDNGFSSIVAANTQVSMAQLAAQVQAKGIDAAATTRLAELSAQKDVAGMQLDLGKTQIGAQQTVALAQLDANKYTAGLSAHLQETLGLAADERDKFIATTAANRDIQLKSYDAQTAMFNTQTLASRDIQLAGIGRDTQLGLANISSTMQQQIESLHASRDIQLEGIRESQLTARTAIASNERGLIAQLNAQVSDLANWRANQLAYNALQVIGMFASNQTGGTNTNFGLNNPSFVNPVALIAPNMPQH